jgi:hypothetical protein
MNIDASIGQMYKLMEASFLNGIKQAPRIKRIHT